jgi:hypothetical protein
MQLVALNKLKNEFLISFLETLIYCLCILKIEDSEIYRNAVKLQKIPTKSVDGSSNEWISAMIIIANVNSFDIFTKSQLADFLTLSTKGVEEKRSSEIINNLIYKIYMDIIESYESLDESLELLLMLFLLSMAAWIDNITNLVI